MRQWTVEEIVAAIIKKARATELIADDHTAFVTLDRSEVWYLNAVMVDGWRRIRVYWSARDDYIGVHLDHATMTEVQFDKP